MLRAVMHLIHRELLMALRQRSDILNPLWFSSSSSPCFR